MNRVKRLTIGWRNLAPFKFGTERQQSAARVLDALDIIDVLDDYNPLVVGSVPLDIDVTGSDLNIICEAYDLDAFIEFVRQYYGEHENFRVERVVLQAMETESADIKFTFDGVDVHIVAQPIPIHKQDGYRHMEVEGRLLLIGGKKARRSIRKLKEAGMKTEPAFAEYFRLKGDPYERLRELADLDDSNLRRAVGL